MGLLWVFLQKLDFCFSVLEFELRKAKDTIRGLREQLTVASGKFLLLYCYLDYNYFIFRNERDAS